MGRRIEQASGMMSLLFVSSKSNKRFNQYDFMPHETEPTIKEQDISLEQAKESWS